MSGVVSASLIRSLTTESLFADGSNYVVSAASARSFFLLEYRQASMKVAELPMVTAMNLLHVRSFHVLAVLLGVGYYVIPALCSAAAVWVTRHWERLWVPTMLAAVLISTIGQGMVMESVLAAGFFCLSAALLSLPRELRRVEQAVLLVLGLIEIATYEAFAFLAPILLALLARRVFWGKARLSRTAGLLIGVPLAISTVVGLRGTLHPRSPTNESNLIRGLEHISILQPATQHVIVGLLGVLVVLVVSMLVRRLNSMSGRSTLFVLAIVLVVTAISIVWIAATDMLIPLGDAYRERGSLILVVAAIMVGASFYVNRARDPAADRFCLGRCVVVGSLLVGVALTCTSAIDWSHYQAAVANLVNSGSGAKSIDAVDVNSDTRSNNYWSWPNSMLGVALAAREGTSSITNEPGQNPVWAGGILLEVDNYASNPTPANFPSSLRGFHW